MTDPDTQPNGDTQRLMEAKGIPVESAIVTRRERRHLTSKRAKRKSNHERNVLC